MFPFSTPAPGTPPTDGTPPQPLSPQPAVSPQSGELAPGAPVEFSMTPPVNAAPAPFGSELPPSSTPAPSPFDAPVASPGTEAKPAVEGGVKMMTTREAEAVLDALLLKGEYQKVADATQDIMATDPSNAHAQELRTQALAALSNPVIAKRLQKVLRAQRLKKQLMWAVAGVVLAAGLGVGGWMLFLRTPTPPEGIPSPPVYKISVKTDPVPAEGVAPLTVTFGLRSESLPEGVTVTFDVGDGVPKTAPFTHVFDKSGTYTVTAIAKAADGTQLDKVLEKVTVRSALEVQIDATPGVGAGSTSVAFAANVRGATGELNSMWSFGDGKSSPEPTPTHVYEKAGTYEVALTVTTPDGSSGTATKSVTVTSGTASSIPESSAPQNGAADAVITTIPQSPDSKTLSGTAPFTVFFSAGSSRSENGALTSTHWDFGDSYDSEELSTIHTFSRPGLYKVTLTVSDTAGVNGTEALTVNVTALNTPSSATGPVSAVIESDVRPSGGAPLTITFDASKTRSTSGAIIRYEWDFGDRSTLGSGVRASHTYQAAGKYVVLLTATDGSGAEGQQRLTVTVS